MLFRSDLYAIITANTGELAATRAFQTTGPGRRSHPHGCPSRVGKCDPLTRTGSPPPSCPWMSSNCAGHGSTRECARLRVLVTARDSMTTGRTRAVNVVTALLRVNGLGLDAREP